MTERTSQVFRLDRVILWAQVASDRSLWIAAFAMSLVPFLLTAHWTSGQVNDTQAAIWPAWWFTQTGSFYLQDVPNLPDHPWFIEVEGNLVTNRMMGAVLAGVPLAALLGWTGMSPVLLNALNAALLTAGTAAFLLLVFRNLVSTRLALSSTIVVVFGSALWTVAASETWPHTLNAFMLAMAMYGIARNQWWVAGLGFGVAITARPHLALAALIVGLGGGVVLRRLHPVVAVGLPSVAGVVALATWNRFIYGTWSLDGGYRGRLEQAATPLRDAAEISAYAMNGLAALFTPTVGLFVLSPIFLVATYWMVRSRSAAPRWTQVTALAGVAYQMMQLHLNGYTGGGQFFGNRLMIELVVLASPLAVATYKAWALTDARRLIASLAAAVSVATHAIGALLHHYRIGHPASVEWTLYYPYAVIRAGGVEGLVIAGLVLAALLLFVAQRISALTSSSAVAPSADRPDATGTS